MIIKRKGARYPSRAGARIAGLMMGEALLKDLDVVGCCIESSMQADIKSGQSYRLEIIPEAESKVGTFEIRAESRWVRPGEYFCEMGFMITASPKGREFMRYVEYLAWRGSLAARNGVPAAEAPPA
ncbi:MAG: PilZ domain-containing protein [Treponema sp.]|jgi:hypothetical protein|nr:PilZ domain-containing protein [Treponema sp.]